MSPKRRKDKTGIAVPPFLSTTLVAKMLKVNPVTIQRRFAAGQYPGAYKPSGKTSTIQIPASCFPKEQIEEFFAQEQKRDQSAN